MSLLTHKLKVKKLKYLNLYLDGSFFLSVRCSFSVDSGVSAKTVNEKKTHYHSRISLREGSETPGENCVKFAARF